tara:strand:+ start:1118 stop:2290 length:1173 start_codon:yes stop_codon:yes gene_type:complete
MKKYDFIISGAGLVGCLAAIQLNKLGFKCCIIEKNSLENIDIPDNFSPLSLNYHTYLFLKKYGLWSDLSSFTYPINMLTLKSFNSLNRISFKANDINLDNLGYIIDKRVLLNFLRSKLEESSVEFYQCETIDKVSGIDKEEITISFAKNLKMKSTYLIVSDGIDSKVKKLLNIDSKIIDYDQTSYIYNAKASFKPKSAVQIFDESGILAAIPYDDNQLNIILSLNNSFSQHIVNSDFKPNKNFIDKSFRFFAKNITNIKYVSQYKLKTSRAERVSLGNILLLGNSSQLLHPVGAQGYNLAVDNIDSMIKNLSSIDKDITKASDIIESARQKSFQQIDFATNILGNSRLSSRALSWLSFQVLKCSQTLKNDFLRRIIGLNNIGYLSIGKRP